MALTDLAEQLDAVLAEALELRVATYEAGFADLYSATAPRDSGLLASSLLTHVAPLGDGSVVLHMEVDDIAAPHGKWIDQPTDLIVPVRAKVLHWFGAGGESVFARQVVPSRVHEGWWQDFVDRGIDTVVV